MRILNTGLTFAGTGRIGSWRECEYHLYYVETIIDYALVSVEEPTSKPTVQPPFS